MWYSLGPSSVPTTSSVVFYDDDPYTYGRLWVVQPGGTPRLLLSATTRSVGWERLSPDGTWVYFVRGWSSLWRVHLDGTGLDSLMAFSAMGGTNPTPTVSPDGGSVAVAENNGIKIFDVATRSSRVVPVTCGEARYSPDGAYFACLDALGLSVVRSDGTGQRHVADLFNVSPDMSSVVDWSPDGHWMLISTGYAGAILVEVSSGAIVPLTALGSDLTQVRDASFVR
jgi:Tol biopolymer transport system component